MTRQRIMGGSVACIPFTLSLSFSLFVYTLDIIIILYIATYILYVTDKYISIYERYLQMERFPSIRYDNVTRRQR